MIKLNPPATATELAAWREFVRQEIGGDGNVESLCWAITTPRGDPGVETVHYSDWIQRRRIGGKPR